MDAATIAARLAECDPVACQDDFIDYCVLCGDRAAAAYDPLRPERARVRHEADCPWLAARALAEPEPASTS